MSAVQLANVVTALRLRCAQNVRQGGTGFVTTDALRFDVGLRTATLRRVMDAGVRSGSIERQTIKRSDGQSRCYLYRVPDACT